jgi:23S rRNA G2069 N7-methylase RlmK/C1962 C5-methylase RlmI
MQGKRFRNDTVEIEAFKVDHPGGKWVMITYYEAISQAMGWLVKRCDELPTEYPDFHRQVMVPIKWKNWTGESKEFRVMDALAFLSGASQRF